MNIKVEITEFFKALSDPTRLNIIQRLHSQGEMCVCDITAYLQQPTVSRHLNYLKNRGLLTRERRGTWMWYSLREDLPDGCKTIINALPELTDLIEKHQS